MIENINNNNFFDLLLILNLHSKPIIYISSKNLTFFLKYRFRLDI